MSQAGTISSSSAAGGIQSITTDSGTVTGNNVQLYANTGNANTGSSVLFKASTATEMDLILTDANNNTILGLDAGNASIRGILNTGVGREALKSLTSGVQNTAIGYQSMALSQSANQNTSIGVASLADLVSGSFNIAVGNGAGAALTGTDSNNIIIGNNSGVSGDNDTIRIGNFAVQSKTFIAGITGNSVSNAELVTINSITGQLGVTPINGTMFLISSKTAANVASVTFTSGISGYDVYYLMFYGVTIATNSQNVYIQLSTNGGSTYNATTYSCFNATSFNGGLVQGVAGATSGLVIVNDMDNSSSIPASGFAYLYNFANTSFVKQCVSNSTCSLSGDSSTSVNDTLWTTTTAVNAFQIIPGAGNILTGTFKLFGIVN